jgi:MYXO-CTERM domain-containing protein
VLLVSAAVPTRASAETELKIDGFSTGQSADLQGRFADGEIGAVRLGAPEGGRQLLAVRLLYGGVAQTRTVTLRVWDDSGGATAPGAMLYEGDFQLTGANDAMQELSVAGESVFVPAQFRVGIEVQGSTPHQEVGLPGIARDDDGTIAADKNFLLADVGGTFMWFRSQALGLTGDWIIRAVIADAGGTPDAGTGGPDASSGGPDAGSGGPDAGAGEQCNGNGDCEIGEFCDQVVHACTFDCRHDSDCPGSAECNSLGQCVGATDGEGGGCCSTGDGGASGNGAVAALGLAGLVGAMVTRRRRPRGATNGLPRA